MTLLLGSTVAPTSFNVALKAGRDVTGNVVPFWIVILIVLQDIELRHQDGDDHDPRPSVPQNAPILV